MAYNKDEYKLPDCLKLPFGRPSAADRAQLQKERVEEEPSVGYRMRHVSQLSHISHCISEGSRVQCYPGYLFRPDKYYVLGVGYCRSIFHLEQRMSAFYENEEKTKPRQLEKRTPRQKDVKPDFVFAVRGSEDDKWHRCKVVKLIDETECEIFLLESGLSLNIVISNLRYIHKEFVSFPVQAIAIKVSDDDIVSRINLVDQNMDRAIWARKIFNSVIANNLLRVEFKQRVTDNEGTCVWMADVSVISQIDHEVIWLNTYMELKNRIKLYGGI